MHTLTASTCPVNHPCRCHGDLYTVQSVRCNRWGNERHMHKYTFPKNRALRERRILSGSEWVSEHTAETTRTMACNVQFHTPVSYIHLPIYSTVYLKHMLVLVSVYFCTEDGAVWFNISVQEYKLNTFIKTKMRHEGTFHNSGLWNND